MGGDLMAQTIRGHCFGRSRIKQFIKNDYENLTEFEV